jgi:ubiquinone/menaquinone biosynthesis C-methylase UbiE
MCADYMDAEEYKKHLKCEKKNFDSRTFRPDLTEKSPTALIYLLHRFQLRVRNRIGSTVWDYVVSVVNNKIKGDNSGPVKILSIGSGPGGAEMNIAHKFVGSNYVMECIDINENLLSMGQTKADKEGLKLKFIQQDMNSISLSADYYDVIFAHASLHHMVNHEHITSEINKSMKTNAEFIVYDIITRNGMRMWDETREIANKVFSRLPLKYRLLSWTRNQKEKYLAELPDRDLSTTGFECIRSQDLYPILKKSFKVKLEVEGFCFARRFFDQEFGDNYDIDRNPFDKAIADTIIRLDEEYESHHHLKPESIFLVLER